MYKIVKKEVLNSVVVMMEIEAPYVAARCEAGQFVIVRVDEDGERIPLTIADFDRERNTVEIIFQVVGYSTTLMAKLNEGDYLQDFVGPLGQPAPLNKEWKRVIGIAGGVGAAPLYPQAKKLAEQGTKVDVIIGGRTAELVLLKEKFEKFCDNVYIMTDDGSLGEQGVVTKKLQELLDAGVQYDHAIAIGPLIIDEVCSSTYKEAGIQPSDSRFFESDHDRWYRYVWRMSCHSWWRDKVCMRRWTGFRRI